MNREGSSGGGRSSLGYLFEPETTLYRTTAKSHQEAEKTPGTNTNTTFVRDDKKTIGAEADQELPRHGPPKREVSNPILSSHGPCNIYHTSQLTYNSGLLITDRPSTRVRCAPGGPSSLGFLFGEEQEK